jgi:hypothetical protein
MLNKAWFIIFLWIFCLGENLLAQKQEFSFKQNSAVSLNLSTLGVGAAFHLKYNDAVAFRGGFSKGNLLLTYNTSYNNTSVKVDTKFKLGMIYLFADYYPSNGSLFRITGGLVRNYNLYDAKVIPATSQTYGYITYSPEQLGNIKVYVKGAKIVPYIGIGFGNPVPRKKISLGTDIGLFIHGKPEFDIQASGVFSPTNSGENLSVLTDAFSLWSLFPYLNLHVKYRLFN